MKDVHSPLTKQEINTIPAILLACAAVLLWILWDKSDKDFDDIRERLRNKHE